MQELPGHLVGVLFLALVLAGPAPLAVIVAGATWRHHPPAGAAHWALAFALTWCVIQTLLGLALGALGLLRPLAVLTLQTLLLVIGAALMRRARMRASALPRGGSASPTPVQLWEWIILGGLGSLAAALLWQVSAQPITDGDSLAYHLPAMVKWYQSGRFEMPDQYLLFRHYPYCWEALCALFLMPFREDLTAALPSLVPWAMLGLAAYCLARLLQAGRDLALSAVALMLGAPIVVSSINTIHVDLPLAAFSMTSLYFASAALRGRSSADLGLSAAAAGMTAGVKTSGILYGLLLVAYVSAAELMARLKRERQPQPRSAFPVPGLPLLAAGIICGVVTGGFWYFRNWAEIGNPLGPVAIRVGAIHLPGNWDLAHFRRTTLAAVFQPSSWTDWKTLLAAIWQQFGLGCLVVGAGALLCLPALALGRPPPGRRHLVAVIALTAIAGCLYAITPYSGDNGTHGWLVDKSFIGQAMRYALPLWAGLAVAAALAATAFRLPPALLAAPAAVCLALRLADLGLVALLVAGAFAVAAIARTRLRRLHVAATLPSIPRSVGLALALAAVLAASFAARQQRDERREETYGGLPSYLAREVGPEETIGYFMSNHSYLLYGKDLSKRVVWIPLQSRDRQEWLNYLRAHQIAVIAAGPVGDQRDAWQTYHWLESGRLPVVRVFGQDFRRAPYLYRLRDEPPPRTRE